MARTIDGTPGPDRLVGTVAADVIRGRGGSDLVFGGPGADFLQGDGGRDAIVAGQGTIVSSVEYDGATDTVAAVTGSTSSTPTSAIGSRRLRARGRRLSRDPYTTPDAQHETQVEPDSFTVGSTTVTTFQVGRRFDGAATNIGYAVTPRQRAHVGERPAPRAHDREPSRRRERAGQRPGRGVRRGAPRLAHLHARARRARRRAWRSIARTDGATWSNALVAAEEIVPQGIAFDKNWIACDNTPTSPYYGRCYLTYTHASDEDMLAVTTRTTAGSAGRPPTSIGARRLSACSPSSSPAGELVVVYLWERGRFAIASSRSADGGLTFDPPVRIAEVDGSCAIRGFRAFPLPSADVDSAGRVWATWHDCEAPGASRNAAFVSTSADGVSWSAPTSVTAGRNAVLPAIGIDSGDGTRGDRVPPRSRAAGVDVELVESRAEVTGFGPPRRLSARSMRLAWMPNTTSGRMLADYISVH